MMALGSKITQEVAIPENNRYGVVESRQTCIPPYFVFILAYGTKYVLSHIDTTYRGFSTTVHQTNGGRLIWISVWTFERKFHLGP